MRARNHHRRHRPLLLAASRVAVGVALLSAAAAAPAAASPLGPGTELWITLGADAFDLLAGQADHQGLERLEEQDGVVLTQVRFGDLAGLSASLHESTGRCAGFLAHRTLAQARAALAVPRTRSSLAGGVSYSINQTEWVTSLEADLDKPSILATIDHLSTAYHNRYHAYSSGAEAAEWIRDLWRSYAETRPEVTVELVSHPGINQPSVVLTIPGSTFPDQHVVLGGHLDSVSPGTSNPNFLAPGADDNASGIAVLGEIARVVLAADFRPQRTVQIMGYAAEEIGLVGSQDIADGYEAAGRDVVAVLQFDMTDYFGSVEDMAFLSDYTNADLTAFLGQLVDTYQPVLAWTTSACGYGCSDHAAWHRAGYPASMSAEARFGQHNPAIHSTSDTLATLGHNVDHAFKFARLGLSFLIEIGNPERFLFRDGFETGSTEAWSQSVP